MHTTLTWSEIALRLFCTIAAGSVIGINRGEHGRPAGLRTSLLVSLAACLAMLQVNLLLPLAGRPSDSFVMNDLMRLPLGILSGMGFIGAGAIVRRDNFVVGVTTAATMWFLTVLGLCFGGGQIVLGLAGATLGVLVLTGLKQVEDRIKQDHQGHLMILASPSSPDEEEIRGIIEADGFRIASCAFAAANGADNVEFNCELRWRAHPSETRIPPAIRLLTGHPGIVRVAWTPQAK